MWLDFEITRCNHLGGVIYDLRKYIGHVYTSHHSIFNMSAHVRAGQPWVIFIYKYKDVTYTHQYVTTEEGQICLDLEMTMYSSG